MGKRKLPPLNQNHKPRDCSRLRSKSTEKEKKHQECGRILQIEVIKNLMV